jgi:hypothetical protein
MTLLITLASSGAIAAAITGLIAYFSKRSDNRTQVIVGQGVARSETEQLAFTILKDEVVRKTEVSEKQGKEISDLKVINFLVLQHLINVDRHFAEGNPPPPPPIPDELLAHLRDS